MSRCHGFVTRVTLVGVASAALGALVAGAVGIAAVDHWLCRGADQRLRGAVAELAGELDEEPKERLLGSLMHELADENAELKPSGIWLSVFRGRVLLAGRGPSRTPDVGDCETQGVLGERTRSCSRAYGVLTLVATTMSDRPRLVWWYLFALFVAGATGASVGGLLGRLGARVAVRPLSAIERELAQLQPGRDLRLRTETECREIASLRREIEALLVRQKELLDQAEQFAANAAHELRSPLARISARLELCAERLEEPARGEVVEAERQVGQLSALVERLLVLVLPIENLAGGFEAVALDEVIGEVLDCLPVEQRVHTEYCSGPEGLIFGDPELLATLIRNALDNALCHGKPPVVIWLREGEQRVVLCVKDEGPGISSHLRERVFRPLVRLGKSTGAGHGLGLSLIDQVARAHGGCAEFVECSGGACLEVVFPAWSPEARGREKPRDSSNG